MFLAVVLVVVVALNALSESSAKKSQVGEAKKSVA
jgi:hypothetical protein